MSTAEPIDLATVPDSVFRAHVEQEFTLRGAAGEFSVTLEEIADYPVHESENVKPKRKPFGLVFKCESAVLPQGIYTLEHSQLPPCDLFLSPFEGGEDWCKLEAIFN